MRYQVNTDHIRDALKTLRVGDQVLLSGTVYTARDAAHKQIFELLDRGEEPPFPLKDAILYYAGPTPARGNMPVGACGPTTAGRMDGFVPRLLGLGVAAMIGKGERNKSVQDAVRLSGACYFCAAGGAGAWIARCVRESREVAFPWLGCESVKQLTVCDLPLIVALDRRGGNLFVTGRAEFRKVEENCPGRS
ncbi:MAG: FumA C-terminus/TtdB family hydratase beta subunit [Oscillospiraceae bacterium]|nr:FumA C-terminus/TtdB family hydratase beta subunit [Oscillospiraceae bacterium]